MKKATVAVFLLLSVLMAFGRNVTDQEVATALKRALQARDNLNEGAEVQVSSALATGKDICIEYRASTASGQSISGLAVYRTEDELVFLDNSWIWERACLSGKYGQRRNGKDLTHALNASLAAPVAVKPAAVAANAAPAPALAPIPPAVVAASTPVPSPSPSPQAGAKVTPVAPAIVTAPSATRIAAAPAPPPAAPPAPAQVLVIATSPAPATPPSPAKLAATAPTPTPVVMASMTVPAPAVAPALVVVSAVVTSPPAVANVAQPAPVATTPVVATPVVAIPVVATPVAAAPTVARAVVVARNPAAATETALHGVTIIDDNGALGSPTSTASATGPVESLADVARRVRTQRTMQ